MAFVTITQDSAMASKERGILLYVFMLLVTAILEMLFILLYKSMLCGHCPATYGAGRFGAAFFAGDPVGKSAAPVFPRLGRTSIIGFLLRENIQSHFIKPAES
jgi:hypothetical protein